MTREPKDILDMPVLATSTGRDLGTVKQLLFLPGEHLLYGFVIKPRTKGDPDRILLRENIKSIGEAAVTIEKEEAAGLFDADSQARELLTAGGQLHGTKILTEEGNEVGKVDTLLLDESGSIAAYKISSGVLGLGSGHEIKVSSVVTAGPDAIIVSSAALQKPS